MRDANRNIIIQMSMGKINLAKKIFKTTLSDILKIQLFLDQLSLQNCVDSSGQQG